MRGIIINITSSPDIGLEEVEFAANLISKEANPEANIIWGAAFDNTLEDEMKVTVVATGFEPEKKQFDVRVQRPVINEVAHEEKVAPVVTPSAVNETAEEDKPASNSNGIDDDLTKIFRKNNGTRFFN